MIGFEHAFSLILSGLSYVAPFVGVLIFVVFSHEFGHFAVGRMCGAKVDVFSIGMGPELAGFADRFGTRWRLSALPIGGFYDRRLDALVGADGLDEASLYALLLGGRA